MVMSTEDDRKVEPFAGNFVLRHIQMAQRQHQVHVLLFFQLLLPFRQAFPRILDGGSVEGPLPIETGRVGEDSHQTQASFMRALGTGTTFQSISLLMWECFVFGHVGVNPHTTVVLCTLTHETMFDVVLMIAENDI